MERYDLVLASILYPAAGNSNPLLFSLSMLSLLFLTTLFGEAYLAIKAFSSNSPEKNALVLPILATSLLVDLVLLGVIYQCVHHGSHQRNRFKNEIKKASSEALSGRLPKLITIIRKNKITYTLPLFAPKESVAFAEFNAKSITASEPSHSLIKKEKTKTRPVYSNRFFENQPEDQKTKAKETSDILKLDNVVYRRLYSKDKIPMKHFVGYTSEDLHRYTTDDNRQIFKNLLDAPQFVAPRGHSGFVFRKEVHQDKSQVPFKLKFHGDARLLFTPPEEAKLNEESIALYRLSGAKTHNQMGRD